MSATPLVPNKIGEAKYIYVSNEERGITSHSGGGQANAYKLTAQYSEVGTSAADNDSVRLPEITATPGLLSSVGALLFLANGDATHTIKVYGGGTDTINGVATGTGNAISAGAMVLLVATSFNSSTGVGTWRMINTTSSAVAAITSGTIAGVTIDNSVIGGGTPAAGTFTSVVANDITGGDASLGIAGLAAAQGGAVATVGGTSSTAGNAGGAVTSAGGTPGLTGVGGAVGMTGGAGGATSGTGGAATVTGGAGTNGNALGGAATVTAGAGQGTGNGAVASLVGGASGAGATGTGGAVVQTGGAALSTNGNGGASSNTGGAGNGTGNGGASGVTGGASGTGATGTGGAATITGGAALSTNGTGGAASLIGGVGNGNLNGGAITITSGAAGATGVAGAVNISVGAATAGAGSAVTITGGNGAGGTAAGGNVNIVPGTAVSTGIPGEVQVNSVAGLFDAIWQQYLPAAVPVSGSSYTFFMANRAYRVKAASCSCSSSATVPTVDIIKDTGTGAPGAGSSVLTGVMTFDTTANTRVVGTVSSTIATVNLAAGNRLAAKWGGTVGSITGAIISVTLVPI